MTIQRGIIFALLLSLVLLLTAGCGNSEPHRSGKQSEKNGSEQTTRKNDTEGEWLEELPENEEGWKKILTEDEFHILRERGTEPPGSGDLLNNKQKGTYVCAGCGQKLFPSDAKFESGTGWPSFYDVVSKNAVKEKTDTRGGMNRTEILCGRCDGHLGHVFSDGPEPTGLRYCINSLALDFRSESSPSDKDSMD